MPGLKYFMNIFPYNSHHLLLALFSVGEAAKMLKMHMTFHDAEELAGLEHRPLHASVISRLEKSQRENKDPLKSHLKETVADRVNLKVNGGNTRSKGVLGDIYQLPLLHLWFSCPG